MVNTLEGPGYCLKCGDEDWQLDEDGYCYDCWQEFPYCDAEPCGGRVTTPGEFLCNGCAELVRKTGMKS